jgi:tetratricopeptide (TPR) repeat protein
MNNDDIDGLYYRGMCYLKIKKYDLSIKDLSLVIKMDSKYFLAHKFRVHCYFELE